MADDNHFAPSEKVDVKVVDDILEKTIDNIQNGKVQIFEIAESARTEYDQMQQELKEIKNKVREVIQEVDNLEKSAIRPKSTWQMSVSTSILILKKILKKPTNKPVICVHV
ncbi:hypothetical protein V2B37_12140 [Natranaerobius thermophilus JW/NM-WN-LF]